MKTKEIINLIEKLNLKPATRRDLSLLNFSIISFAYVRALKKEIGFCYSALAAIGKRNKFYSMINEEEIAQKTKELIEKHPEKVEILVKRSKEIFNLSLEKIKNDKNSLKEVIETYKFYMVSLGIMNCFWRYSGIKDIKLSEELMNRIAKERKEIASLYLKIEEMIKNKALLFGKENNFDGDLLRYMTLNEFEDYFKTKTLSQDFIKELEKRREGYFYIMTENSEFVSGDESLINEIKERFFRIEHKETDEIKGHPAYSGIVKGFVCNLEKNRNCEIKENSIVVISATKPDDTIIIEKALAIVTDEGGILSHAAIVAREKKKPCIVGTRIATEILKDGDYIEVNADKGIVTIIKRK